jgi:hypothetical protein
MTYLKFGTQLFYEENRLVRITDPDGLEAVALEWGNDSMCNGRFLLPDRTEVFLTPCEEDHPILGAAYRITYKSSTLAQVATICWSNPATIPAVDKPGNLPAGAGTAILNIIARLAPDTLRYQGPYRSAALFQSLQTCFRVASGDLEAAQTSFLSGAEEDALLGRVSLSELRFNPDPFEAWWQQGTCVHMRNGLERAYILGKCFQGEGTGRSLRKVEDSIVAGLFVDEALVTHVATFEVNGRLKQAITEVPDAADVTGLEPLPPAIVRLIVEHITAMAPQLLRTTIQELLGSLSFVIGEPPLALAALDGTILIIHRALIQVVGEKSPTRLIQELIRAVYTPVSGAAQRLLHDRWTRFSQR